jgi:hypothetical protein
LSLIEQEINEPNELLLKRKCYNSLILTGESLIAENLRGISD